MLCGVSASRLNLIRSTAMMLYVATLGWPSNATCKPGGWVLKVSRDVCGRMSRCTVSLPLSESFTNNLSLYHTLAEDSPVNGITKLPDFTPGGMLGPG